MSKFSRMSYYTSGWGNPKPSVEFVLSLEPLLEFFFGPLVSAEIVIQSIVVAAATVGVDRSFAVSNFSLKNVPVFLLNFVNEQTY